MHNKYYVKRTFRVRFAARASPRLMVALQESRLYCIIDRAGGEPTGRSASQNFKDDFVTQLFRSATTGTVQAAIVDPLYQNFIYQIGG